jgi:hypothetical protein
MATNGCGLAVVAAPDVDGLITSEIGGKFTAFCRKNGLQFRKFLTIREP